MQIFWFIVGLLVGTVGITILQGIETIISQLVEVIISKLGIIVCKNNIAQAKLAAEIEEAPGINLSSSNAIGFCCGESEEIKDDDEVL